MKVVSHFVRGSFFVTFELRINCKKLSRCIEAGSSKCTNYVISLCFRRAAERTKIMICPRFNFDGSSVSTIRSVFIVLYGSALCCLDKGILNASLKNFFKINITLKMR